MLSGHLMVLLVIGPFLAHPVICWVGEEFHYRVCVGDYWNNTHEDCLQMDLQKALSFASHTNHTLVLIAAGRYTLNSMDFYNVRNIAIVGSNSSSAKSEIVCEESNSNYKAGLGFFNSFTIRIENVIFKNCGMLRNSTIPHPDKDYSRFAQFHVSLYFGSCEDITIRNV